MAVVGWIINFIAYISPTDLVSNTSKWVKSEGFNPPQWLQEKNTDRIVHYISFVVIAVALIVFLWPMVQLIIERWKNRLPPIPSQFIGKAKEYIKKTSGYYPAPVSGVYELRKENSIHTNEDFSPPITFRVIAKTSAENIRVKYAETEVVFNWETNTTHLRVDGGPAGGQHQEGTGEIPPNQWVRIDMVFKPNSMEVFAEGTRRCARNADFSKQLGPIKISQRGLSVISVQSILVERPH
jgi:hypothetical protein